MKRNSIVYFLIPLVLVFLFTPSKGFQIILLFFILLILLSKIYSLVLEKTLQVNRNIQELKSNRFDKIEITLYVENHGILPCPMCFISDRPGILSVSSDEGRTLLFLKPKELKTFTYLVTGYDRGLYDVGPIHISSSDPLGMFPFEIEVNDILKITVRPARIETNFAIKKGIPQGSLSINDKRYEDVTLYRSSKDYETGDEVKRINWKAYAKFNKLFTNEYQYSLNCPIFVFLNLSEPQFPLKLKHDIAESAIEVAASIITKASFLKQNCGFASSGTILNKENNQFFNPYLFPRSAQTECILDLLAEINLSSDDLFSTNILQKALSTFPTNGKFFYIGPLPPTLQEQEEFEDHLHKITNYKSIEIFYCGGRK